MCTRTWNSLAKKDGGNVAIQKVGTYFVYHCYLAESRQQVHFSNERERERTREYISCQDHDKKIAF